MDAELIRIVGQIAGIGGLAIGALLLIFRDVIRKEIFPSLTREHAYRIIRLLIVLTFLMALAGTSAWVWVQTAWLCPWSHRKSLPQRSVSFGVSITKASSFQRTTRRL